MSSISFGNDQINALVLQSDGNLVAGGQCNVSGTDNFCLARYDTSGRPDLTFGIGGKMTTDFGAGMDRLLSMIVQPDGKWVGAEYCHIAGMDTFCLARFNAD